jgi:hypothetical protein
LPPTIDKTVKGLFPFEEILLALFPHEAVPKIKIIKQELKR